MKADVDVGLLLHFDVEDVLDECVIALNVTPHDSAYLGLQRFLVNAHMYERFCICAVNEGCDTLSTLQDEPLCWYGRAHGILMLSG